MVVTGSCKRLALGLMTVILAAGSVAVAADGDSAPNPGPASALEFRLDGDFTLTALRGTTVSWKQYDAGTHGWRLGVSPLYWEESWSTDEVSEETHKVYGLDLEWQRLGFWASRSRARPYWGLGLVAGASRIEEWSRRDVQDDDSVQRERTGTEYRAGLVGTIGAEFTIAEKMVIGAEYSINAIWSRERTITTERNDIMDLVSDRRETRTVYQLTSRVVALTVAILF